MVSRLDAESPSRNRRFYSVGSMVVLVQYVLLSGLVEGFIAWIMGALRDVVVKLSEFAGWFITTTIEWMLFFPPPGEIVVRGDTVLNDLYWGVSFPLFFGLLSLSITVFFLMMQLSPESDETNLDSFMQRVFISVVLVIVVGAGHFIPEGGSFPQQGLFGYGVEFINLIGEGLFPDAYQLEIDLDTYRGIATTGLGGFAVLLLPIIASPKIFLTYATFLTALGIRAVVIYTTYALFPILIALWVGEAGPLKYGKMVSSMLIKATIMLLLLGVLLSGILGIGGAIVEGGDGDMIDGDAENVTVDYSDKASEGTRLEGGVLHDDSVEFTSTERGAMTASWMRVFTFFGSIWLCITIVGMTLGGFVSTGFSKNMAKAERGIKGAKKAKDGIADTERLSGNHDSLGDRVNDKLGDISDKGKGVKEGAKEKTGWTEQNANSETFAGEPENRSIADDMRDVVGNVKSTTDSAKDKAGDVKDKAGDIKDGVSNEVSDFKQDVDKVTDEFGNLKENVEEAGENFNETMGDVGDKAQSSAQELGEKAGSIAGGYGAIGGRAIGTAVGGAGNMAISGAGKMGEYGMKAGAKGASASATLARKSPNLAKRGGKAYWSVFKQPDVKSSLGEVGRIAKESPIAHPDGPGATETDTDDNDDEETRRHRDPADVGSYDTGGLYQGRYDKQDKERAYNTGSFYNSMEADVNRNSTRDPAEPGEEYQNQTSENSNNTRQYNTGSHYQNKGGTPNWTDAYDGMESRGHSEPKSRDKNPTSEDKKRPNDYR